MNATTKFLLLLIVLACAGFFVKGPGGKPYLSLDALKWWTEKAEEKTPDSGALVRKMETIKEKISEIENPFSKSGGKDVVYKWKDEKRRLALFGHGQSRRGRRDHDAWAGKRFDIPRPFQVRRLEARQFQCFRAVRHDIGRLEPRRGIRFRTGF